MSAAVAHLSVPTVSSVARLFTRQRGIAFGVLLVWAAYVWCGATLMADKLARLMAPFPTQFVPSDFFVPWFGAKSLLAGENPYSAQFAERLHLIFYGVVVQPSPEFQNPAAFAYPPFVAVALLPFIWLPFEVVRWLSLGVLALSLSAVAALWLRLVRPNASRFAVAAAVVGALTFFPSLELLWLQQLTGLVILMLAGAAVLAARQRYALAGALLGLALVKPQLALIPIIFVAAWGATRRERWALLGGLLSVAVGLVAFAQLILPDWINHVTIATNRYRELNTVFWLPAKVAGPTGGPLLAALIVAGLAAAWWRGRRGESFPSLFAFTCACTIILIPDVSFYNRALLIVPIISLASVGPGATPLRRATFRLAALAVVGPVLLMAGAVLLRALATDTPARGMLLDAAEAAFVVMPLLLAPGLTAVCLSQSTTRGPHSAHRANRKAFVSRRALARGSTAAIAIALVGLLVAAYVHVTRHALLEQMRLAYAANGGTFFPSDLYQPWIAGRALLAGVNPYTDAFASELHRAFFGVPLHDGPGAHPEIRFFYPPFVVFVMAPFLALPFEVARWASALALAGAIGAAAWLWARTYHLGRWPSAAAAALALLFVPSQEIIWIQQLSGFAIFFVIAGFAAAAHRRYAAAGVLLALSLFKPQLGLPPALPLLLWSLWHRERWPMWIAFGTAALAQLALAEALMPGWIGPFLATAKSYQEVNDQNWLPAILTGSDRAGTVVGGAVVALLGHIWWRLRRTEPGGAAWLHATALTLAARAVLVPDVSYYNRALLIAPLITIVCALGVSGPVRRLCARLALTAAALPVAVLGALGLAGWLGFDGAAVRPVVLGLQGLLLILPTIVLAALLPVHASFSASALLRRPTPAGPHLADPSPIR